MILWSADVMEINGKALRCGAGGRHQCVILYLKNNHLQYLYACLYSALYAIIIL
jgi:hypothetical protein